MSRNAPSLTKIDRDLVEFGGVVFKGREEAKPLKQRNNQQQTQPIYDTAAESNPSHALSLLSAQSLLLSLNLKLYS